MAQDPAGDPQLPAVDPPERRARAALRGFMGFAVAVAASVLLVVALWLTAKDAPSAAGQPFRFTPPPEPTALATATATVTAMPTGEGSR